MALFASACDSSSQPNDTTVGQAEVGQAQTESSGGVLLGVATAATSEASTVGFPNWDSSQTYPVGSYVRRDEQIFVSKDTTTTDPLIDPEGWEVVEDVSSSSVYSNVQNRGQALYWNGEWENDVSYTSGAMVAYQSQAYVAIDRIEAGTTPDDTAYWSILASKGEAGADGAQGNEGAQGPIGLTGLQGDQGDTGLKGDTGEAGPKGDAGDAGPKGDSGEAGPKGDTGEAGAAGSQGLTWTGQWSVIGGYDAGEAVGYNGSSYVAVQAVPANTVPTDASYWDVLAEAGDDSSGDGGGSGGASAYVVVGRSSTQVAGNAGFRALNAACKADYGSTARLATSLDLAQYPPSAAVNGLSWIKGIAHPSSVSVDDTTGMDLSASASNLTCDGWASNTGMALTVYGNTLGMNEYGSCSNTIGVLCAAQSTAVDYEFKGFSTASVSGGVGYLGMANACRTDFGSDARIANTQEIANSNLDSTRTGTAWVQGIAHASRPDIDSISGVSLGSGQSLTCKGWSNGGSVFGLNVDVSTYSIGSQYCYTSSAVACAAPI